MPEGQSKKRRFSKKNVKNAEIVEKMSKWLLFEVFSRPKNAENMDNWHPWESYFGQLEEKKLYELVKTSFFRNSLFLDSFFGQFEEKNSMN